MQRVAVIGNSGGKSLLARQIAERFRLPYVEIDTILRQQGWGGDGAAVPLDPADVIYVNAGATENDNPIVPTCRSVERRAQRQSRMPPAKRWHRRSRRNASLTERARRYPSGGGTIATAPASAGLPPRSFCLIIGGRTSPRLWGAGVG